jgi:polysaccharide deacetylase 2 family uncharacterized protein YibQ
MAQGIWSGIGLGAVFSVSVAAIVSVLVPMEPQPAPELGSAETVALPQDQQPQPPVTVTDEQSAPAAQPQVSLRAPVGEELPKEPDAAAMAPQVDSEVGSSVIATQDAATDTSPVETPASEAAPLAPPTTPAQPQLETAGSDINPDVGTPLSPPIAGDADDLPQPRPLPESTTARAGGDEPVLPNPQALAPMIPDDSQDAEISAEAPPPQITEPTPPVAAQPEPEVQDEQDPVTTAEPAPRPRVLPVPGTQVEPANPDARPQIGRPANTLISRDEEDSSGTETLAQTPAGSEVPLSRFSQPFENPEGKPLMSIILMDTGADLDAAEIGLPALSSFPYPVSFAVDANLPDAQTRMQRYRAEGFDVLAMVDLPPRAQPTDAEVSMSVALDTLDEVVGVLEGTGEGLQSSREVADQVTGILKASGHGLVAQSKGLNSMPKLAVKEGVPAAAVFRDFDSEGQEARVIRRFLDQAAFKAGQEGGVIMLGRLRPETIEALLVWGLADRAGAVALAPVSAVLLRQ